VIGNSVSNNSEASNDVEDDPRCADQSHHICLAAIGVGFSAYCLAPILPSLSHNYVTSQPEAPQAISPVKSVLSSSSLTFVKSIEVRADSIISYCC